MEWSPVMLTHRRLLFEWHVVQDSEPTKECTPKPAKYLNEIAAARYKSSESGSATPTTRHTKQTASCRLQTCTFCKKKRSQRPMALESLETGLSIVDDLQTCSGIPCELCKQFCGSLMHLPNKKKPTAAPFCELSNINMETTCCCWKSHKLSDILHINHLMAAIHEHYMGAVLNLSSFLRYFIHLALALAPSCASQGFSAKWYPNTNLVYFAFHVAYLARVTFTIDRVFICRHLFPPFLNCCDNVLESALCKLCSTQ